MDDRIDLGEVTDVAAITRLVDVGGLKLVDVGCGAAANSRELAGLGAMVDGVEPDAIQAAKNRDATPFPGLALHEGFAEQLPLAAQSVDGVLFFRSLHHVPIAAMDAALREAVRVLKPATGFLCVVEPGMTGSHFQVMRPYHDETVVRIEAQAALTRLAGEHAFREHACYRFLQHPRHASFEAMVERVTGHTYNRISRASVETEEVRSLFEAGRTAQGDYAFEQPMLLDIFRAPG
jgi:ubiquinone/menaquinone biosynthesis C-methylase UbiE